MMLELQLLLYSLYYGPTALIIYILDHIIQEKLSNLGISPT